MDSGATGALSTYQLPVFNRTWCIVYRVVSTNYWYWYGINTSSAGQCVVMSNGTIRVRSGDGTQFLPTFSAPAVGVVVVLTFQLSQDNADVVYRVITGSQTAVTETRYAGRTLNRVRRGWNSETDRRQHRRRLRDRTDAYAARVRLPVAAPGTPVLREHPPLPEGVRK